MKTTVKINFNDEIDFDQGCEDVEYSYEIKDGEIVNIKSDHPKVAKFDLIRMRIDAEKKENINQ